MEEHSANTWPSYQAKNPSFSVCENEEAERFVNALLKRIWSQNLLWLFFSFTIFVGLPCFPPP